MLRLIFDSDDEHRFMGQGLGWTVQQPRRSSAAEDRSLDHPMAGVLRDL